jgi:hypothetical protein
VGTSSFDHFTPTTRKASILEWQLTNEESLIDPSDAIKDTNHPLFQQMGEIEHS